MSFARTLCFVFCALIFAASPFAASAQHGAAPPATKDWRAWENRMPGIRIEPGKTTLLIVAEIETPHEGARPVLTKLGEREGEKDALELELTFAESEGDAAPAFRPFETLIIVPIHRYKRLYVLHNGAPLDEQPIEVRPAY